jgi:hypothetical protein
MNQLEEFYIPLRLTGFAAWLLSCVLAAVVLVRSGTGDRRSIARLAAAYLVSGGLGIALTVAALGQHYSYTDVVMNDVPLGFDLDFFGRHVGIAVIGAWLVWRVAAQRQALRWWVVVLASLGELLVRADNTALLVWLEPSLQEGGLAGAVLPPIAGAVGIIVASGRYRSTTANPSGA